MSLDITIHNHSGKPITIQELLKLRPLAFGIDHSNGVLEENKTGEITILYDEKQIGRGFEVQFEQDDIHFRVPLPTTEHDIALVFELIEKTAMVCQTETFEYEDEKVDVSQIDQYIQTIKETSLAALQSITNDILSLRNEYFILYCARNPLYFGMAEAEKIKGDSTCFQSWLHEKQVIDVFYASLKIYQRSNQTYMGFIFVGEEIPTVVPVVPRVFSDLTVLDYYCYLPGDNVIPYAEFIDRVRRQEIYDSNHVIVCLNEDDINELSCEHTIDYNTNQRVPFHLYNSQIQIDNGAFHNGKIARFHLDCDPLAGYNHLAIFLRWAYEHDGLSIEVLHEVPQLKEFLAKGDDIRPLLQESPILNHRIFLWYFKSELRPFVKDYYQFQGGGNTKYPGCVDDVALRYFGKEKYECEEFHDEAYLFVPYDEKYYETLSGYIEEAYQDYLLDLKAENSTYRFS